MLVSHVYIPKIQNNKTVSLLSLLLPKFPMTLTLCSWAWDIFQIISIWTSFMTHLIFLNTTCHARFKHAITYFHCWFIYLQVLCFSIILQTNGKNNCVSNSDSHFFPVDGVLDANLKLRGGCQSLSTQKHFCRWQSKYRFIRKFNIQFRLTKLFYLSCSFELGFFSQIFLIFFYKIFL